MMCGVVLIEIVDLSRILRKVVFLWFGMLRQY